MKDYKVSELGLHASWMRNMITLIMFGLALLKLSLNGKIEKNLSILVILTGLIVGILSTYDTFYLENKKQKIMIWHNMSVIICILNIFIATKLLY